MPLYPPAGSSGTGDMEAATYDPQNIADDAFDTDNHTDGTTNKVYTAVEKTKLAGVESGAEVNNISDANATDLTDGGTTTLHSHTVTKSDVGLANVDNTSDATKQAATLLAAYPVGSVYLSVASTDPGTLFGGTWAAFGAGKMLVGRDSGDTDFDTAEETGGSKTQASNVTVANQPTFTVNSHTHTLSNDGQAKITVTAAGNVLADVTTAASWTSDRRTNATSNASQASFTEGAGLTGATDATSGTATTRTQDVTLTNNAVNNLPPYIVVYMFKRTA